VYSRKINREMVVSSAVVREKATPIKACLKTLPEVQESNIEGPPCPW
jgi:hypothetical protein